MSRFWLGLVWPPAAPWREDDVVARRWWLFTCLLGVLPVAAVLHHVVFYRASCMLNPFGNDYTPDVVWMILRRDPSVVCAIVGLMVTYWLGRRWSSVRLVVAPLFVAFLPVTIWVWDLPFTGRLICDHLHDGRLTILGAPVRTRHLDLLCLLIYALLLGRTGQQRPLTERSRAAAL